MLTLKAPEALVADLESFAREQGMTRHAAALEAIAAGIGALRGRGDTRVIPGRPEGDTRVIPGRPEGDTGGDTEEPRAVIPRVIPDAEALADLVAEKVVARLAGDTRGDTRKPGDPDVVEVHRFAMGRGLSAIKAAVELLTGESDPVRAVAELRSALFELDPYLPGAPRPLESPQTPDAVQPVAQGGPVPESPSGRARRAPGQAPRRPGDHKVGGSRKADPPEGSVAALVLTWRRARGLSQDAAAEVFGVARKTWGRWETGERHPEAAVVERIKAEV